MHVTEPAVRTSNRDASYDGIDQTANFIATVQTRSGQIPWYAGANTDPWGHVEATMALDIGGRHEDARAAYEWLRRTQNPDGSWYRAYRGDRVVDATRESNFTAYLAVGVWHHFLSTGDEGFLDDLWPTVCSAMSYVLRLQAEGGQIVWARSPDGRPASEALLSGCASMFQSLQCALAIAEHRGEVQPDWELAAASLGHAIAAHPLLFSSRDRYSMDWYYPVLGGVVRAAEARTRLDRDWTRFVVPGLGVRCVADRPWVTVAETSELVLTLCILGDHERAQEMLATVRPHRCEDGSYWTGYVYLEAAVWPEERTTWTAGAVVLALAALALEPATTAVFAIARPAGESVARTPTHASATCPVC